MKKLLIILALACTTKNLVAQTIDYHNNFESTFVAPRNIEVWLPKEYQEQTTRRFPVLYMHDGQNVFNAATSYGGVAWEADSTAAAMIADGRIEPIIIVAIWNSPKRFQEYCPEKPISQAPADVQEFMNSMRKDYQKELIADEYLKFIVKELKPFIDNNYRTHKDAHNTSICGSSMGGLISMYAIAEYPKVFGQAACVSTHWPLGYNNDNPAVSGVLKNYLNKNLPSPATHRIYFDHGTATLDALYEVHQNDVDAIMVEHGYREGVNWVTRKFEGAIHSESAWRDRFDIILSFLYAKPKK